MLKTAKKIVTLALAGCLLLTLAGCKGDDGIKIDDGNGGNQAMYITPTPIPLGEGALTTLPECKNDKDLILVTNFYQAIKEKDLSKLSPLLSDPSLAGENLFDDYKNVSDIKINKVYALPGTESIDEIVYVYYDVVIDDISVPSLDELYISSSGEAKFVFNGAISHEEHARLVAKAKCDGADQLKEAVNNAFKQVITDNPSLQL